MLIYCAFQFVAICKQNYVFQAKCNTYSTNVHRMYSLEEMHIRQMFWNNNLIALLLQNIVFNILFLWYLSVFVVFSVCSLCQLHQF